VTLPLGGPAIWVVGVDAAGVPRVKERLTHGDDPGRVFATKGYRATGPKSVTGQRDPHEITITYEVEPAPGIPLKPHEPTPHDPGLETNAEETPTVLQRLAVYAVVHSSRGLLLAQNSALTNAPGTWGLAGGGVDAAELPENALHREVWEETGQVVEVTGLVTVTTRHWLGRAPHGRLEDFHAVRVVYRATCADPTDPVVHDANGTTSAAVWLPAKEIRNLALAPGTRDVILGVIDAAG
jgi:8-oxo-dGTP pyrophosphatase MutT (NUDIX family)